MHAKQTIVSSDMLKSAVFWHVKPCSLAARYRFGETVDSIFRVKEMFLTNFFRLYGETCQKTGGMLTDADASTSNLTG